MRLPANSTNGITSAAAGALQSMAVFTSGQEGYHTFRIPSLLATPKGSLLAFCEGRKLSRSDSGDIDLVLKRSADGGKAWSKLELVWDDGPDTCGNPCPVVDRETGTIWLLLTHNLGVDKQSQIMSGTGKGTRTVWAARSTDDGQTWSKPVEITKDTKRTNWTWYATGPGVGIQLRGGRLLAPCDHAEAGGLHSNSHVIFSDDHGATWNLGGVVGPKCDESQAIELADGSVLLNMRSYRGKGVRLVAVSKDGGLTFSQPREDPALIEPVCQASILRSGRATVDKPGQILFSNPASQFARTNGTVRLSFDEGKTWPVAKTIWPGGFAYSCLAELPDGSIGLLFESDGYREIRFARFRLDWLGGPKAPAPGAR